jgi:hypothetical protein
MKVAKYLSARKAADPALRRQPVQILSPNGLPLFASADKRERESSSIPRSVIDISRRTGLSVPYSRVVAESMGCFLGEAA